MQHSLTSFPDLEKIMFFPEFSVTMATPLGSLQAFTSTTQLPQGKSQEVLVFYWPLGLMGIFLLLVR